jgi:hypothetical protein
MPIFRHYDILIISFCHYYADYAFTPLRRHAAFDYCISISALMLSPLFSRHFFDIDIDFISPLLLLRY